MTRKTAYGMVLLCFLFMIFPVMCTAGDAPRISKEELKALLGSPNLVVLDVRTDYDSKENGKKIKGALRVDPNELKSWAPGLQKDRKIVLYCS